MELQSLQTYISQISRSLTEKPAQEDEPFWGKDGFDFADILDIINPLQHLPIISKFYRQQTDDEASEGSRLLGGVVFGGLIGGIGGALSALTNSVVRHETQQDLGDYLIAEITHSHVNSNNVNKGEKLATINRPDGLQFEENPFFAQLLELEQGSQKYLEYTPETELARQLKIQRITQWGKV